MIDTRVWMYRDGEAVCFASPKAVPNGKGWSDRPAPDTVKASGAGRRENNAAPATAEHLTKQDLLQSLKARATALGIRYRGNIGARKLTQLIREKENHGPQS